MAPACFQMFPPPHCGLSFRDNRPVGGWAMTPRVLFTARSLDLPGTVDIDIDAGKCDLQWTLGERRGICGIRGGGLGKERKLGATAAYSRWS